MAFIGPLLQDLSAHLSIAALASGFLIRAYFSSIASMVYFARVMISTSVAAAHRFSSQNRHASRSDSYLSFFAQMSAKNLALPISVHNAAGGWGSISVSGSGSGAAPATMLSVLN